MVRMQEAAGMPCQLTVYSYVPRRGVNVSVDTSYTGVVTFTKWAGMVPFEGAFIRCFKDVIREA